MFMCTSIGGYLQKPEDPHRAGLKGDCKPLVLGTELQHPTSDPQKDQQVLLTALAPN